MVEIPTIIFWVMFFNMLGILILDAILFVKESMIYGISMLAQMILICYILKEVVFK